MRFGVFSAAVWLLSTLAVGHANLIVNGSFESGNTGFTSDYTYKVPNSPGLMNAGEYSVIQSLNQVHSIWAGAGSLSAQSGTNYLAANGSTDTNASPWMQTITVNPGDITVSTTNAPVYYRFQAYIASVYPAAPPQLAFEMSLNNSGAWQQLTTSVTIPTNSIDIWYLTYRDGYFLSAPTTISFRLRNTVSAEGGNDFAIDSIYFGLSTNAPSYPANAINSIGPITGGVVPEPGSWAAASLLALTAGFVRWRKRI
ncbi:MAG: hypothetical protein FGM15_00040 [Chthoniobacterales bacterium]|nr:hypothetical protein [Chthoniobacterales bacterium]